MVVVDWESSKAEKWIVGRNRARSTFASREEPPGKLRATHEPSAEPRLNNITDLGSRRIAGPEKGGDVIRMVGTQIGAIRVDFPAAHAIAVRRKKSKKSAWG
jgi:hypothetical protein